MPAPFITTSDLGSAYSSHAQAAFAIEAACDAVRTFTEQTLHEVTDDVILLDGNGTEVLLLPELPVTDVDSVYEDDELLVVDTDYALNDDGVLVRLPTIVDNGWSTAAIRGAWQKGRQNIEVTFTHGWASGEMPADIRMVARNIAIRFLSQTGGISFESLGQYSVRYESSEMPANEKAILRKYKVSKPSAAGVAVS